MFFCEALSGLLDFLLKGVDLFAFDLDFVLKFLSSMKFSNEQDKNLFMILKQLLKKHILFLCFKRRKRRVQKVESRFQSSQRRVIKSLKFLPVLNHFRQ